MKNHQNRLLVHAALAGIVAAASFGTSVALAEDHGSEKGRCIGANSCKGKSACAQEGKNSCSGQNGCSGKGFLEKTKAECEKLAKKDPHVKFVAGKAM